MAAQPHLTPSARRKLGADDPAVGREPSFGVLEASNKADGMRRALSNLKPSLPESLHKDLDVYQQLFEQYVAEEKLKIDWNKISPPPKGMIIPHATLPEADTWNIDAVSKLAVLKLNGGLGTSMGCKGPKSAITVRDGLTFLDLAVKQVESLNSECGTTVPLVLMNSFNTHADTDLILQKYEGRPTDILRFNQSQMPRIWKDVSQPVPKDNNNKEEWFPPGHGDLYRSLESSGLLDQLIAAGKEYIFISNIDNLGAVVDPQILSFFHESPECEFIMEVTDKTRADVKGGTLIEYEGKMRLLEIAQVPKQYVDEFKSISKFRIFNTNNLWIKLSAIKNILAVKGMHMEIIENKKSIGGKAVIQLEQASGSAIKNFNCARGINVPRSRFLPVKQSQDLILVMSDLFKLAYGQLSLSNERVFSTLPLIKLGPLFNSVDHFLARFETMPKILELDHLTVSGDVHFGPNVVLKGTVIIIANEGQRIDIPGYSLLENKIVTGDLRILDH